MVALLVAGALLATKPALCHAQTTHPTSVIWSPHESIVPGGKGFIVTRDGRVLCTGTQRGDDGITQLRVFESRDWGKTFNVLLGVVDTESDPHPDLGDASLLEARDGSLWIAYRHNHLRGPDVGQPRFAIKTARSVDGGSSWSRPTVVAKSVGERGKPSRGLWASFLLQRSDGVIQCYYDDEDRPTTAGLAGNQWVTMKTWDATIDAWASPVTAARAHDPNALSRDGMPSVVELAPGKLLMAFESVDVQRPHANLIRSVTSDDGGATWSWQSRERETVYQAGGQFLAYAPWMTSLGDGRLVCVFCTDEDRDRPATSGTLPHRIPGDVKSVVSLDGGKTWGAAQPVAATSHRYYLPGIAARTIDGKVELLAMYLDFSDGKFKAVAGSLPASR